MTDSAGTTVWKAAYEPFGKATITVSSVPNNLRYDGQYFDQETGLHYNGARYYDPKIGRYISSDPIGLRGGLNTYLYARANPLRYIDPLGLDTTMTCRPVKLFGNLGLSEPVHCSVIVWHWEAGCDGKKRKIIDGQYSLLGGGTSPTTDPNNPTFQDDRNAFNNPGGSNTNYNIPAPPGTSQSDFDRAVMNSGSNYSQGTYMPPGYGPNSNTAANNIIQNAGGTPPNVPGAWGQHYTPQGNPNAVPGIPW
jgi:RHS repeat-associated protein